MSNTDLRVSSVFAPLRGVAAVASVVAVLVGAPAFAAHQATSTHHRAASEADHLQRETIEQRIHTLHSDLGITQAEEPAWSKVVDVMRSNESTMRNMVQERRQASAKNVSAVDDLIVYEKFNQVHLEGVRKLIASFQPLYQSMPDAQKVTADRVFRGFGRERPLHG